MMSCDYSAASEQRAKTAREQAEAARYKAPIDYAERLFKLEQLKYRRKNVNARIDSTNATTSTKSREDDMASLSRCFQELDKIDLEELKLLEGE